MERKWWTLLVVCVGTFMLLLDITIVNVALPKIASDLHASFSDIQWVIDAYALTLASVLLTAGSLADLFGRRLLYAIGLSLFSFTSLLCAVSPSALFLILARAGQGIGGAIMFATALALLAQEFHGRERGTAFGDLGRDDLRRGGHRPAARRRAHGGLRVAVDLPDQRADRDRGGLPDRHEGERVARSSGDEGRLGRDDHVDRGPVPTRVRDHPRQLTGAGGVRRS